MTTLNTPTQVAPERKDSVEGDIGSRFRTGLATLALLLAVSGQVAQAQSTPQAAASDSVSASADKGVGYGQMTKDGREFGKLTEKEVDGLGDAEYDTYQKWKIVQKNATVIGVKEERKDVQATLIAEKRGLEGDKVSLIATYSSYIDTFSKLHALKGRVGFNESIYNQMKGKLKAILLSGEPPEILTKLEPLRAILTA